MLRCRSVATMIIRCAGAISKYPPVLPCRCRVSGSRKFGRSSRTPPHSVPMTLPSSSLTGTAMTMIQPGIPDVYFARLQFPSGIGAHLHVSWIDPRKVRLMTVVGDRKMVVYDDVSVDQKLSVIDAGVARQGDFGAYESLGDFQWRTRAGDILIPKIDMTEPLRNEMEAFAVACATGEAPPTTAAHGADVVAILTAIDESAAAGGTPVELR